MALNYFFKGEGSAQDTIKVLFGGTFYFYSILFCSLVSTLAG